MQIKYLVLLVIPSLTALPVNKQEEGKLERRQFEAIAAGILTGVATNVAKQAISGGMKAMSESGGGGGGGDKEGSSGGGGGGNPLAGIMGMMGGGGDKEGGGGNPLAGLMGGGGGGGGNPLAGIMGGGGGGSDMISGLLGGLMKGGGGLLG